MAPPPLKPVTHFLVSVKTCTRQSIVIGIQDVVVAGPCVLPMKPIVELVDMAIDAVFPVKLQIEPLWVQKSLIGARHTDVIASMGCPR